MEETAAGAAHDQLGADALARLRDRYTHVAAAIARRVPDLERRERLNAEAERLNPDRWLTAEDVQKGLEQYETVFESLRGLVGRRRRRRKSRGPGAPGGGESPRHNGPPGEEATAQEEDRDDDSETGPNPPE